MNTDSRFDTPQDSELESRKSPETLEREIDQQRSSIGSIVDALEKKMSPGQLVDQALGYVKENGGEFFGNLGSQVRANPVPAVLTTVGVFWLMMGDRTPAAGPSALHKTGEHLSEMKGDVTDGLSSAKARVQEVASHLKGKASHMKDEATHVKDRISDTFSSSTHSSLSQTYDEQRKHVQSSARTLLNEQPLALAAIGIAIGAVIGAALPATEQEKRLIHQAKDKLTRSGAVDSAHSQSSSTPSRTHADHGNPSGTRSSVSDPSLRPPPTATAFGATPGLG